MTTSKYEVKSGDTLTRIAKQHNYASWQEIYYDPENVSFRAKRPNPDKIYPGDVLVLPRRAGSLPGLVPVQAKTVTYHIEERDIPSRTFFVNGRPHTYDGTGTWENLHPVADPASLDPRTPARSDPITFHPVHYKYSSYAFEFLDGTEPNWYLVVVPRRAKPPFANVNVFFHPSASKMKGKPVDPRVMPWLNVSRYKSTLGKQLGATSTNQVIIIPLIKHELQLEPAMGRLLKEWKEIFEAMLSIVLAKSIWDADTSQVKANIENVVVSDFSFSFKIAEHFASSAKDIKSFGRERWDFDGDYRYHQLTDRMAYKRALQYDQRPVADARQSSYHLPASRWVTVLPEHLRANLTSKETCDYVHGLMIGALFHHAARSSLIGTFIAP